MYIACRSLYVIGLAYMQTHLTTFFVTHQNTTTRRVATICGIRFFFLATRQCIVEYHNSLLIYKNRGY